jgi:hypothetical protein
LERKYWKINLQTVQGGDHRAYVQGTLIDPNDDDVVSHAVSTGILDPDEMELVETVEEITQEEYSARAANVVVNLGVNNGVIRL